MSLSPLAAADSFSPGRSADKEMLIICKKEEPYDP